MTESRPLLQKDSSIDLKSKIALKSNVRTRFLFSTLSLSAAGAAFGLYFFTQYTIASVVIAFFAFGIFAAKRLVQKSIQLTAPTNPRELTSTLSQLGHIKQQVRKCKFLDFFEAEGTQAAMQADLLVQHYKGLKNILSEKFEPSEITFSRYLGVIEASCLSIGENLLQAKNLLENLCLSSRGKSTPIPEPTQELHRLLQSTDEALQGLANLYRSLNEMNTQEKYRDQLEHSMEQVKILADRAKIYSKQ